MARWRAPSPHGRVVALVVRDAGRVAHDVAGDQARGPAAVGGAELHLAAVFADALAEVVARVDAIVVAERAAGGPARVERVEIVVEQQALVAAVAVVGIVERQPPPAAAELAVAIEEGRRIAVDAGRVVDAQLRAETEQVQLLEGEAGGVLAALASIREPRVQGPDVGRDDLDVDDAVVPGDRRDPRVVQVARAAQQAFGLGQQARVVGFAAAEQQLGLDGGLARADVRLVGEAEQRGVLLRQRGVEDFLGHDPDRTDPRACGLQRRVVGHAGGPSDRNPLRPRAEARQDRARGVVRPHSARRSHQRAQQGRKRATPCRQPGQVGPCGGRVAREQGGPGGWWRDVQGAIPAWQVGHGSWTVLGTRTNRCRRVMSALAT